MIKINDKTLKALKEQLETIQENGIYNVGFVFELLEHQQHHRGVFLYYHYHYRKKNKNKKI